MARREFDHAPTHIRSTMTTSIVDAEPQGAARLAEPTVLPLLSALSLLAAAVGVLVEQYAVSVVAVVVLLGILGAWAWRNETEMSEEETRPLGELLIEVPGPRWLGWWGALGAVSVLLVGVATLAFSTLFLQVNAVVWAPEGTVGQWLPSLGVGLLVALAGLATWWGGRQGEDHLTRAAGPRLPHLLTAGTGIVAGLLGLLLTWFTWSGSGLDHTANAYSSAAVTMLGAQAFALTVGTAMSAAALLARLRHARDIRARLMLHNAALGWAGILLVWATVWAVTDLLPRIVL